MEYRDEARLFASIDSNVRLGTISLSQSLMAAKANAARQRNVLALALTRVSALLLAAQYEARLNWLVWHPWSRLDEQQRAGCLNGGIASRWEKLLRSALVMRLAALDEPVEIGAADVPTKLPPPYRGIYYDLRRVKRTHLDPLIDNRNSLAHGEWAVALTKDASGLNAERTQRIQDLTLFQVVVTANLLDHFWKCYFDAIVTRDALERDFAVHHQRMMHAARRLTSGDEEKWLYNLQMRYKDGRSSHGGLSMPPHAYGARLPRVDLSPEGTVFLDHRPIAGGDG